MVAVYGADALANCIEIRAEKHGIRLLGFLGNRNYFKANRTYQSLFVNGRFVVNQTVGAAVTNAYASYLMKRQYPFYVLFLDVPPEVVDVNVRRLRMKIEEDPSNPKHLLTVWGLGYKWIP